MDPESPLPYSQMPQFFPTMSQIETLHTFPDDFIKVNFKIVHHPHINLQTSSSAEISSPKLYMHNSFHIHMPHSSPALFIGMEVV
jgi:hypothetical protein